MSKTMQEKIEQAFKMSQKIIDDTQKLLDAAIEDKNWKRAAELDSYISGMEQTLIVFEQAIE